MDKMIRPVVGWELHDANRAGGWHNAAIRIGNFVFLSGMIGVYPGTKQLAPTVEDQVRLIFQHLDTALSSHGASLKHIVQMTMFFTDRKKQWPVLDRVRRELFPDAPPTSTGVGVTELDLDAALEINGIAVVTD